MQSEASAARETHLPSGQVGGNGDRLPGGGGRWSGGGHCGGHCGGGRQGESEAKGQGDSTHTAEVSLQRTLGKDISADIVLED
ncbi:hypothetical protein Mame01_49890 [Microbispora amethystogenes]|nr:hypothetical protein Mame01_49890 [Microbispora amethystogenes]